MLRLDYGTTRQDLVADTIDVPVRCPPGTLCIDPPVGWRMADGSLVVAYRATQGFQGISHFGRVR